MKKYQITAILLIGLMIGLFCLQNLARAGDNQQDNNYYADLVIEALNLIEEEDIFFIRNNRAAPQSYAAIMKTTGCTDEEIDKLIPIGKLSNEKKNKIKNQLKIYIKDYLNNKKNKKELTYKLIRESLLPLLQDKYAIFMTQQDYLRLVNNSGDGLTITTERHKIYVLAVVPGSAADKAGLKPFDHIVAINGHSMFIKDNEDDEDLEDRCQRELNVNPQKIVYKILRDGVEYNLMVEFNDEQPLEENKNPANKNVFGKIDKEDKDIGIITIKNFQNSQTKYEFYKIYKYLVCEKKVKALIIDLHDNFGGYLYEARAISSFFTQEDNVIVIKRDGHKHFFKSIKPEGIKPFDGPIAVITNYATASAAELLTCILELKCGAIIIGSRTCGKNIGQEWKILSDGSILYISGYEATIQDRPNRFISWLGGITPHYDPLLIEGEQNNMTLAKEKLREKLKELSTP